MATVSPYNYWNQRSHSSSPDVTQSPPTNTAQKTKKKKKKKDNDKIKRIESQYKVIIQQNERILSLMENLVEETESIKSMLRSTLNNSSSNASLTRQKIIENANIILPTFPIQDANMYLMLNRDLANEAYFNQVVCG